jgi:hypothetical protein
VDMSARSQALIVSELGTTQIRTPANTKAKLEIF